jgi:hypothetical protein
MGDKLGHLQRILKAAALFALLYSVGYLQLSRRLVKGAVDLHRGEILGIIGQPLPLLFGESYWVEPAHPIVIGPAAATYENGHEYLQSLDIFGSDVGQRLQTYLIRFLNNS